MPGQAAVTPEAGSHLLPHRPSHLRKALRPHTQARPQAHQQQVSEVQHAAYREELQGVSEALTTLLSSVQMPGPCAGQDRGFSFALPALTRRGTDLLRSKSASLASL